jgi:hypothetical protein
MSKKHPSPSARMILEKHYAEQGQGVEPGKLANAMHAMNEELGLSEPRTILVRNLGEYRHDGIDPQELGVTNERHWSKYFKKVVLAKEGT